MEGRYLLSEDDRFRPTKTNIAVTLVALAWTPHDLARVKRFYTGQILQEAGVRR